MNFTAVSSPWARHFSLWCLVALLAGCAAGPIARAPESELPDAAAVVGSRLTADQARDVTFYAMNLVGTPYRYGGNTPDSGFDCSGLIAYVYRITGGLQLPRTVASLQDQGQPVSAQQVRSGDLVLFGPQGASTHAGIYVGNGRFVHAPSTGGEVRLDSLGARYWAAQPMRFRRM